jgi:hypothetical protein
MFALRFGVAVSLGDFRLWQIVLKKSFLLMTENSQDRWCVSLAAS